MFHNIAIYITLQIGSEDDKLYVLVNSHNVTSVLTEINSTYNGTDESIQILREDTNSISCVFSNGISIVISAVQGVLNIVAIVPPSWKGSTKGLLGNYNGNKDDDFVPRGADNSLPGTITDRIVHFNFAQTCTLLFLQAKQYCLKSLFSTQGMRLSQSLCSPTCKASHGNPIHIQITYQSLLMK